MGKTGPAKVHDERINLHLPAPLKMRLAERALARNQGLNEHVREVLEQSLKDDQTGGRPT